MIKLLRIAVPKDGKKIDAGNHRRALLEVSSICVFFYNHD